MKSWPHLIGLWCSWSSRMCAHYSSCPPFGQPCGVASSGFHLGPVVWSDLAWCWFPFRFLVPVTIKKLFVPFPFLFSFAVAFSPFLRFKLVAVMFGIGILRFPVPVVNPFAFFSHVHICFFFAHICELNKSFAKL